MEHQKYLLNSLPRAAVGHIASVVQGCFAKLASSLGILPLLFLDAMFAILPLIGIRITLSYICITLMSKYNTAAIVPV